MHTRSRAAGPRPTRLWIGAALLAQVCLGRTLASSAAAAAASAPACPSYTVYHLVNDGGYHWSASIAVNDAFRVASLEVALDLDDPRIGALEISLAATPPGSTQEAATAVLKPQRAGGLTADLVGTVFSDTASQPFPWNGTGYAPFTGEWLPEEPLASLVQGTSVDAGSGGSQGTWTLHVQDTAPNADTRPLILRRFTLTLCPWQPPPAPATPAPTPSQTMVPVAAKSDPTGPASPAQATGQTGPAAAIPTLQEILAQRFPHLAALQQGTAPSGATASPLAVAWSQDPTYDKVIRAVLLAVYLSSQTDNNLATMDGLLGGLQGQLMGSGDAGSGTVLPIISAARSEIQTLKTNVHDRLASLLTSGSPGVLTGLFGGDSQGSSVGTRPYLGSLSGGSWTPWAGGA